MIDADPTENAKSRWSQYYWIALYCAGHINTCNNSRVFPRYPDAAPADFMDNLQYFWEDLMEARDKTW